MRDIGDLKVGMISPHSHANDDSEAIMGPELDADEFMNLSSKQRIAKCREMAAEAERLAAAASGEMRACYMNLAMKWSDLADEMERVAAG